jgi:hypothetical protein
LSLLCASPQSNRSALFHRTDSHEFLSFVLNESAPAHGSLGLPQSVHFLPSAVLSPSEAPKPFVSPSADAQSVADGGLQLRAIVGISVGSIGFLIIVHRFAIAMICACRREGAPPGAELSGESSALEGDFFEWHTVAIGK